MRLPVHRPLLPPARRLLPYLRRIDDGRWYSNHGPLVAELRQRLAAHYGVGPDGVQPVANATAGLVAMLMAAARPRGALCMVPSWTFVATGQAARLAGLVPYLVDVEEASWALTPALAAAALARAPGPVAAVLPVAPFGAPLDPAPWEAFARDTGVAVVFDAAAAFDTVRASTLPAAVSLHATKPVGAGEGGFVLGDNPALLADIGSRVNFGLSAARRVTALGVNGKMSEYHAAVALAALDAWAETRAAFAAVGAGLADAVGSLPGVSMLPGYGRTWVSSTFTVRLRGASAETVAAALAARGIETRRWWAEGLHAEPAFADCPRTALPVTGILAREALGLPCSVDQTPAQTAALAEALAGALAAAV